MRISVVHDEAVHVSGHARRTRRLLLAAAAAALASLAIATSASAADSGANTSTVNISPPLIRSITLALSVDVPGGSFGLCVDPETHLADLTTLTIPDGICTLSRGGGGQDYVRITNGPVPGHINVNGGEAVPTSGEGSGWALGTSAGPDVYTEKSADHDGEALLPFSLTASPSCDGSIHPAVADLCAVAADEENDELVQIGAPTSSTATASNLTVTTTWTAVP